MLILLFPPVRAEDAALVAVRTTAEEVKAGDRILLVIDSVHKTLAGLRAKTRIAAAPVTPRQEGDRIVPVYTMYIDTGVEDEDLQESEFDGQEIIWQDGMTVTYANLNDGETEMYFCFVFNDIFGDTTMSEMIAFTL